MEDKIITIKNKIVNFLSNKKNLYSVIGIAVLVIILIIGIILLANSGKHGNTFGNLNNLGFSASKSHSTYYIAYKNGESDGIHRIKGKKDKKISDVQGYYLNIVGNSIYFRNSENGSITKMSLNGKKMNTIVDNVDDNVITVANNYIYFFEKSYLYRVKTNGKNKKLLIERAINGYQVVGDWIYYEYKENDDQIIAKIRTDGKDNTVLVKDAGNEFYVNGNQIYFIKNAELYTIKTNGKDIEKISDLDPDIDSINFIDNTIYYTRSNQDGDECIYKYDIKKQSEDIIINLNNYSTQINVHNGWIYYPDKNNDGEIQINKVKTNGENKIEL